MAPMWRRTVFSPAAAPPVAALPITFLAEGICSNTVAIHYVMAELMKPIVVDTASALPPFEQLRAQIASQVADGSVPAGTRLATVRQMASDLGLAPNTVARAYRELEADGVIETRGRRGSFVRSGAMRSTPEAIRDLART